VLARVDRVMAPVTRIAAALLALMLFIGPQVIAEDESKPTGEAAGAAPYASGGGGAEDLFVERCDSCHPLTEAGTRAGGARYWTAMR
jgi:hypothetical protein